MKKTTLVFDLDGTLLDTLEDLYQSTVYTQKELNYPEHTKEQVRQHVGNGIKMLIRRSLPGGSSEEKIEEAFELFKEYYGEHCNDSTKAYDGILELLDALAKQGYKLAIVSNKADFAVKELNKIYFADKIRVAIGEKESEGIRKKPAPDTVFEALRLLESTPEESIYVGDSEVDIQTAKNAQMDCIVCEWGFRDKQMLMEHGGKVFVQEPKQILELLLKEI